MLRYVESDHDLNDMIIAGKARVGIKIPVDYSDRLLHEHERAGAGAYRRIRFFRRRPGHQRHHRDRPGRIAASRAAQAIATFAVEMRPKLLFNPDSRSPNFFLPGLTAIMLLNVTTFLTAFSIVREKERGTLEQLFVTPVRPFGLAARQIACPICASAFSSSA